MNFEYSILNLLHNVREGGTLMVGYEYGYGGNKSEVSGRDGSGYAYVGNLVYRLTGSSFVFESGLFGEGMVSGNGICYHLKDHLGSIRAIIDGSGRLLEENDYYAFGQRHPRSEHAQSSANRFKYNGKELQTVGGLGYLDYGARMYDQSLGRWFTTDPLSEKYYGLSPYVYCGNNPLKYVDSDGRRFDDYFSFLGKYLGSDGKPTSYVRVTSGEEWEKNVKISTDGEKTIFQVDDTMNSVLHSESNINEVASLNVYDYYNMTGLPLSVNEKSKRAGMNFKSRMEKYQYR